MKATVPVVLKQDKIIRNFEIEKPYEPVPMKVNGTNIFSTPEHSSRKTTLHQNIVVETVAPKTSRASSQMLVQTNEKVDSCLSVNVSSPLKTAASKLQGDLDQQYVSWTQARIQAHNMLLDLPAQMNRTGFSGDDFSQQSEKQGETRQKTPLINTMIDMPITRKIKKTTHYM